MTQCVAIDPTTQAVSASSASPCVGYVLLSSDEYAAIQASPFNLTPADGLDLSVAIFGVWAVAWSIKALVRALNADGEGATTE